MSIDSSRVIVRALCLPLIMKYIFPDEKREWLRGTYIAPHPTQGALMVATTGVDMGLLLDHAGVAFGPPQIWSSDLVSPLKAIIQSVKASDRSDLWVDLRYTEGSEKSMRVIQAGSAQDILSEKTDAFFVKGAIEQNFVVYGSFPDYQRVFPKPISQNKARIDANGFDCNLILKAAQFGIELTKLNNRYSTTYNKPGMVFLPAEEDRCHWIRFENGDDNGVSGAVLMMPLHVGPDIRKQENPRWIKDIITAFQETQIGGSKSAAA